MQLQAINQITGEIELLTGLRIGAGNEEMHIGGVDNPVIKHPYTGEPYIPGSSLKGKMRSLLEWRAGVVAQTAGKPVSPKHLGKLSDDQKEQAEIIIRLFGIAGDAESDEAEKFGPSRLSFWDCSFTNQHRKRLIDNNFLNTETKSENIIDRIKGVAEHPRQTERIPAGATFDFRLNLRVLSDDDYSLLNTVKIGLKMLTLDSLGGSGSRGYGKIKFNGLQLNSQPFELPEQAFA